MSNKINLPVLENKDTLLNILVWSWQFGLTSLFPGWSKKNENSKRKLTLMSSEYSKRWKHREDIEIGDEQILHIKPWSVKAFCK